jgi:hypothetical protein
VICAGGARHDRASCSTIAAAADATGLPGGGNFFFTILDECVSIDITEKYKVMSLGDYNQAKKKKKRNTETTLAGWIGVSTRAELNITQRAAQLVSKDNSVWSEITQQAAQLVSKNNSAWSEITPCDKRNRIEARGTHQNIHTHIVTENLQA